MQTAVRVRGDLIVCVSYAYSVLSTNLALLAVCIHCNLSQE